MSPPKRFYFYYLNERGSLFHIFDVKGLVTRTAIPSGPTFLTDPKFLDFFFRRVEYNHVGHISGALAAAAASSWSPSGGGNGAGSNMSGSSTTTAPASSASCSASVGTTAVPVVTPTSSLAALHSRQFLLGTVCHMEDGAALSPLQLLLHFPYVSLCGQELNFVKAQDGVPAVFNQLSFLAAGDNRNGEAGGNGTTVASRQPVNKKTTTNGSSIGAAAAATADLAFAGSLREPFDVDSVVVSPEGKMFHALRSLPRFSPRAAVHVNRKGGGPAPAISTAAATAEDKIKGIISYLQDPSPHGVTAAARGNSEGCHSKPPAETEAKMPPAAALLSSVDVAESAALREALLLHCLAPSSLSTATATTTTTTVPNPSSEAEMQALLTHVTRPPRGLLGASIGLTLGLDFMDEDPDSLGRYTMDWDGEKKVLPLIE